MQIKHRVRINVADRNGNQQNVLESRKLVEIEQLRGEAHES